MRRGHTIASTENLPHPLCAHVCHDVVRSSMSWSLLDYITTYRAIFPLSACCLLLAIGLELGLDGPYFLFYQTASPLITRQIFGKHTSVDAVTHSLWLSSPSCRCLYPCILSPRDPCTSGLFLIIVVSFTYSRKTWRHCTPCLPISSYCADRCLYVVPPIPEDLGLLGLYVR